MYTLTYNGDTLQLPNPELGDTRRISHNDVATNNRSGEVLNIPDGQVTKDTSSLTFLGLRASVKEAAEAFFKDKLGLPLAIVDHNGRSYTGLLTMEEVEFITVRDGCNYRFDMEVMEL